MMTDEAKVGANTGEPEEKRILEVQKTKLEIEKLNRDIRNAYSWWFAPIPTTLPSLLLICTTAYIAFGTNVVELKKERLEKEARDLEVRKKELESQIAKREEAVEELKSENEVLNIVADIQKELLTLPGSSFSVNEYGMYSLHLSKPDFFNDDHNCDIKVLKAINQITGVQSISVSGFVMGKKELELIAELDDLVFLELKGNSITDEHLEWISKSSGLQFLVLNNQKISTLNGLSTLKLKLIRVEDCPLTSHGFLNLNNSKDSLEVVNLISTPVTDEIIPFLQTCKKLLEVRFGDTKVSPDGIKKLLEHEMVHIEINQGQLEEFVKAESHPRLSTVMKETSFISPLSLLSQQWWLYQSKPPKYLFPTPNEK